MKRIGASESLETIILHFRPLFHEFVGLKIKIKFCIQFVHSNYTNKKFKKIKITSVVLPVT